MPKIVSLAHLNSSTWWKLEVELWLEIVDKTQKNNLHNPKFTYESINHISVWPMLSIKSVFFQQNDGSVCLSGITVTYVKGIADIYVSSFRATNVCGRDLSILKTLCYCFSQRVLWWNRGKYGWTDLKPAIPYGQAAPKHSMKAEPHLCVPSRDWHRRPCLAHSRWSTNG